jgi:anaerobic selenocysteine-containing dehydrogenase
MISDFSVLLLEILKRTKQKSLFVMIDTVRSDTCKIADYRLHPQPGKEQELLGMLFLKGAKRNTTGVSNREIEQVKDILKGKKVYLLYNTANVQAIPVPRSVTPIPLNTAINHLKIAEYGIDRAHQSLLNKKDTQCLYMIGAVPAVKKRYQAVIVQDYFQPESEFDVFLPATTFAEIHGSVLDYAGKKKRVRKAIEPVGQSKPDDWIVKQLAHRLGAASMKKRIRRRKKTKTPLRSRIKVSKAYPLFLIARNNSYGYRARSLSAVLKGFARLRDDQHVWLNKETLRKYRLSKDDRVMITGKNLKIEMPVKISDAVPTGFLLVYHHPSMGHVDSQPVRLECTKS